MSIMNRRNAVVGWATWTVFKQVLKRNAKAEAAAAEEESKRSRRFRRKEEADEVEATPKKKRESVACSRFLVATADRRRVWLGTRGRGSKGRATLSSAAGRPV